MALDHVFSPIDVGPVRLANRVVRSAQITGLGVGGIGPELIAYHEARARGGVGLTILEMAFVHPSSPNGIDASTDGIIDGYRLLMERLSPYGMPVFQQLNHHGRHALPKGLANGRRDSGFV